MADTTHPTAILKQIKRAFSAPTMTEIVLALICCLPEDPRAAAIKFWLRWNLPGALTVAAYVLRDIALLRAGVRLQ